MNKRIVVLLSAALLLAFVIQTNVVFATLSPVPTPDFPTPLATTPLLETPPPLKPEVPTPTYTSDEGTWPVPSEPIVKPSRYLEFRLGAMSWDDVWEAIEAWLKDRGW